MRRAFWAAVLLVAAILTLSDTAGAQTKRRGDRNLITTSELAESLAGMITAGDVIRRMRPMWLVPPRANTQVTLDGGASSSSFGGAAGTDAGSSSSPLIRGGGDLVVYVDDTRQPSLDVLGTIKAAELTELRYLDPNRAIQMRGPGHEMGVIEIFTINRKK